MESRQRHLWVSGLNATIKAPMSEMPLTYLCVLSMGFIRVLGFGEQFLYLGHFGIFFQ